MARLELVIGDARAMRRVEDHSVHLVVTSPPYWQLKDYGHEGQIGWQQTWEEYIASLNRVWDECARVLHPGCRMCINIGDQFARAAYYGRYKVIPIRTEIIRHCEGALGLDYMGAIIWQKVTTSNPTGGATVMGSYPYPRNGIVSIDYEFILLFKKLGRAPKVSAEVKEAARLTHEQWVEYFAGHWNFPGERGGHIAAFPEELPRRLIRMFSFPGERVLDPFLGSGTTMVVAAQEGRDCIGYEIDPTMRTLIEARLRTGRLIFEHEYTCAVEEATWEREAAGSALKTSLPDRVADPAAWDFGPKTSVDGGGSAERLLDLARELAAEDGWAKLDRAGRIERLVAAMCPDADADKRLVRQGVRNALQRSKKLRELVDHV
ncbi:MAG: site-specific DNA-methyltransferase [Armatimonadota bacterium]